MLRVPLIVFMIVIAYLAETSPAGWILAALFSLGSVWATHRLLAEGFYDNRQRVRMCALIEVFTYSQLIFSLQGMLGWAGTLAFIVYPYLWFLILNRLTWKTWITPRV
jgi:hypothetical protein